MKFGLDENIIEKIIQVFGANPKVDKAWVFGSRAKGNFRPDSDIDIAVKGYDLGMDDILKMSVALEDIGYKVDLIDYDAIKEKELRGHVDRVGVEVYSNWKEYEFSELLIDESISYGVVQPGSNTDKGVPIIRVNNIKNGNIIIDEVMKIDPSIESNYQRTRLLGGELLITVVGSVGECAIVPAELQGWNVARAVSVARIKPDFNVKFIEYSFKSEDIRYQLYGNTNDTVQPTLNLSSLKKIVLTLPSRFTQNIIANVISNLDTKIDLLHRQNQTLESLAETLFRNWFMSEENVKWEETRLDSHVIAFRGLSYKGNGLTDISLGLPMHNLNSVLEGGGYKFDGIKFYNGEYRERHLVNPGDIIVANTEQGHEYKLIGFPAIVPTYFGEKGIFSQHIYKIIPHSKTYLTTEFIYYLLMTPQVREQIISATNGSTVNMLAIDGLQRPLFRMPPNEKVKSFSRIVVDYWMKKDSNQNQLRTLTQLRDTLLPKLMNGEVRVKTT